MLTFHDLHSNPLSPMWEDFFNKESKKTYFKELMLSLEKELALYTIYPQTNKILLPFELTALEDLKVVILGQDPYTSKDQATGLAFSVNKEVVIPPSLKTIYKELNIEFGYPIPTHGDLSSWAMQGVLMFNTVFSVREKDCLSHKNLGYLTLTKNILDHIISLNNPVVFMLWGNYAKSFVDDNSLGDKQLAIRTAHPSPLAGGKFYNSNCFTLANQFLQKNKRLVINWQIYN